MNGGLQEKAVILDGSSICRAISRISYEILERNKGSENICVIAIMSGGLNIASKIAAKINELENTSVRVGALDITSCRDDERNAPGCDKTAIDFDVTGKKVILVDDVIFTGRSARAAIDALMKRGRPETIQLAALIDRGHRELPIRPDYVGKNVPTSREETVKVIFDGTDGKVVIMSKEESD